MYGFVFQLLILPEDFAAEVETSGALVAEMDIEAARIDDRCGTGRAVLAVNFRGGCAASEKYFSRPT